MLNRRDAMVRLGQVGLSGLTLPALLRAERAVAAPSGPAPRAKACILIFLWGGPPQQDMFDMKPDAPEGIRSAFQPIKTNVPGLEICDQMPLLAQQADKLAIIRSMTHESDVHEPSVYRVLTGQVDPTQVIPRNNRTRAHFPGPGAIVSQFLGCASAPASVTLPRPVMHDGVKYSGTHAGFLGAAHDPLELPDSGFADGRPVFDLGLPSGVDAERLVRRRGLLHLIEAQQRSLDQHGAVQGIDAFRERAFSLMSSPEAKGAFNLDRETAAMRDRYGRNHYGESFLLARRLIEAGVRMVTLNWMFFRPDGNPLNPWDNHGGTPALGNLGGFDMLKADYCIPPLDRAYSALLADLADRGLLSETLVVTTGEFGRTPKINDKQGREHWGHCYSALVSGGGVRGGQVYGASDEHAAYPADQPVRPEDLLATMYHALGIPPEGEIRDGTGRPHRFCTGTPVTALFG
ncbi:MAG: DUF1501 domain-containing protein [Armatimonadota bacterium]